MSSPEEREKQYDATRDDLLARQLSNSVEFDKSILTLSTGMLALSLAFIKDVVDLSHARYTPFLIFSWGLFGGAIISTLLSFMTSQMGIDRQLDYAEKYYLHDLKEYRTKINVPARVTDWLNRLAGIFFVLAVTLTIAFVIQNVGGTER